jgi:hypothetical protein
MDMTLIAIWGVALVVILIMLVLLTTTLRRNARVTALIEPAVTRSDLPEDTLLFYYEDQSVRSTAGGQLFVRIPGAAWNPAWHTDLMRMEIKAQDPGFVTLPAEWGSPQLVTAFSVAGYRMTEMGTDIRVDRFAAPVDILLTADGDQRGLRCGMRPADEDWVLAAATALSPGSMGVELPPRRAWSAVSVSRPGQVCLLRFGDAVPPEAQGGA